MINEGYLIVLNSTENIILYENIDNIKKPQKEYAEFRDYFREYNPINYKGISRNSLSATPGDQTDVMNRIITEKYNYDILDKDTDMDLLQSIDDLRIVYNSLKHKDKYEIIKVYRNEYSINQMTLGFDVGYWGGDHFSLIADTIITPMWHRPIREDYEELRQALKDLNNNLLFKNYLDAEKFREYYKNKHWTETEFHKGEFCIIQIDRFLL